MPSERTLPIAWNLTGEDAITQGADWYRYAAFDYIDPAGGLLTVWDLTGYTGELTIRAGYDSPVILSATTGNGLVQLGLFTIGGGTYDVLIGLPNSTTDALNDFGLGVWDMNVTSDSGQVTRLFAGHASLSREVS